MVKVPEYQPGVELRPIFRQGVDVQASPDAFGADRGDEQRRGDPFAPWYGTMVERLLRRSMDGLDAIEAGMEAYRERELGRKPS